jgi:voltage-gated potassium channel Kch
MVGSDPPAVVGDDEDQPEIPEARIMIPIFLGLLILTVFVMPSLGFGEHHEQRYSIIVSSVLFCSGASIALHRRGLFLFSVIAAVVAVSAQVYALRIPSHFGILCSGMATLAATVVISWTLLLQIFRSKGPVTPVSLQAAIAVYLLFGTTWANAYVIAIQENPHSFQSTIALSSTSSEEWMYYSFVTLTTLGYGEITPRSQVARSLAIGEALVGQLYLAILIARLVGKEMSSGRKIDVRSLIAGQEKKRD